MGLATFLQNVILNMEKIINANNANCELKALYVRNAQLLIWNQTQFKI